MQASNVECPACHGTVQSGVLERHEHWALYECQGCGVRHFWPAKNPGADYYQASEMYTARDLMVTDYLNWYHRVALENMPVNSGRLVDVGCGNGVFVAAARKAGFDASGIDFSESAIVAGKKHFQLETLYATSIEEFVASRDQRFDVVTAFEILEHMDDSSAFFKGLIRLVAPGGHVIVSVPNRDRYPMLLNEGDLPPHHFTRWSAASLSGFIERHGLTPRKIIVCPPDETLRIYLLSKVSFNLVNRLMRRAKTGGGTAERDVSRARKMTRLKERIAAGAGKVMAPFMPFVRGPIMVGIAQAAR